MPGVKVQTEAKMTLARRHEAEGLGTLSLLTTVIGSGIMAERLADGNLALALSGNTIPTGAILVVLITVLANFKRTIQPRGYALLLVVR